MEYSNLITLKDGRTCVLRNGTEQDGETVLEVFRRTHEETDFLRTYPDETTFTVEQEGQYLKGRRESADEIEIIAEVDGKIAGTAGINCAGRAFKTRHRAEFGISILKEYWNLGIGRALTEACIECARTAGYSQLELDVVAENKRAIALYKSVGFIEYGRNPKAFNSRHTGMQELVLMRLELD